MTRTTLQNIKVGDEVRFGRYGVPWMVEERKEPQPELSFGGGGYIAFRTAKGSFKVIGHRRWNTPVTIVKQARAALAGTRAESER